MNFYIDLSSACDIHRVDNPAVVSDAIQRIAPDALCFDYDYPDLLGLKVLRETKLNHPSLPILMLIEQGSEALAIWAFRTGVRDYVTKPVNSQTLYSQIQLLIQIPIAQGGAASRENYLPPPLIPPEARVGHSTEVQKNTLPAISYINNHFQEKVTLEKVARHCGMGPFQFSRAFKREHGLTFQEFLLRYRIDQARALLKNPRVSILDSVFAVGFNDASYFARLFKRYVGVSPSRYRFDIFNQVPDKGEREAAGIDAQPRLLIVDDEAAQMTALCNTLEDQGYVTTGFTSAKEALAALRHQEFDLVLTDLVMPEMDGIALLRAAQEMDANIVGIVMTGHGSIDTAVEAMKGGALDYILKPFKLSVIVPVLARALTVRRLRMENADESDGDERATRPTKRAL
jgi:YesN/AraC family two-component response regulator